MSDEKQMLEELSEKEYKWGFTTDIESETVPPGLNEDVIRLISAKKNEPEWLLEWRLKAYRHWLTLPEPDWQKVQFDPVDYQAISYYSAPKETPEKKSLDEVDPCCWPPTRSWAFPIDRAEAPGRRGRGRGFRQRLGGHHLPKKLAEMGVIFMLHLRGRAGAPGAGAKYLGTVVPATDNFYAGPQLRRLHRRHLRLHAEEHPLPDGAQHLLPHQRGQHRPVRAHPHRGRRGQLRQLPGGLHRAAARREPAARRRGGALAMDDAEIKYSTVQNWYPGDEDGKGGIYNFVTKRGDCRGKSTPRSAGPRWRPARPSPGNIPAASCAATTRWASSTRWP
jgi:Fe-S cluster assembly protein SufB